jgi:hypothetical protein
MFLSLFVVETIFMAFLVLIKENCAARQEKFRTPKEYVIYKLLCVLYTQCKRP